MNFTKKTYIHHYCSLETLFSMVKKKTLWLSDLTESNDPYEDQLVFRLFFEYLENKGKVNNWEDFAIRMNRRLFDESREASRIYGMSFSGKYDSFLQWISYAKSNGVCITFDENELNAYISNVVCLQKCLALKKVKYVDVFSDSEIVGKLDSIYQESDGLIPNCFDPLLDLAPLYKTKYWEKEKEYRVVFRNYIEKDSNPCLPRVEFKGKKCELDYIMKEGVPVFHYEIPLDLKLIKGITIGPKNRLNTRELRCLLQLANEDFSLEEDAFAKTKLSCR